MTNHKKGEKFLSQAEWTWGEVERALEAQVWGLAYRRAQEVVELVLKGLIVLLGAEYPKVHDPAKGFARLARQRGLEIPDETLAEIQTLSSALAKKRGPAFYGEIDISRKSAYAAAEGAAMVLELGLGLKAKLTSSTAPAEETE